MNTHYSMTNPATVHDEEALTALELIGRTTAKVNEVVRSQNKHMEDTQKHLSEQDADIENQKNIVIPQTIKNEVLKYINDGEFDKAIDLYAGELEKRLNNLLSQTPNGSTTMDAEIIDGRLGYDEKTYSNLGEAIRKQLSMSLVQRKTTLTDANEMTEQGTYFKGGGTSWSNVPDTFNSTAGVIITICEDGAPSRKIQICVDYQGNMYFRPFDAHESKMGAWVEVVTLSDIAEGVLRHKILDDNDSIEYNADDLNETAFHLVGSSHTVSNIPGRVGLLTVYKGKAFYNLYQTWYDYYTQTLWIRNYIYNEGWSPWKRTLTTDDFINLDSQNMSHKNFEVVKVNDSEIYIYKIGTKGYVRYRYKRHINESTNLDVWRLYDVAVCDNSKTLVKNVSDYGADIEGVVILEGDTDHIGGIHGDEKTTSYKLFIDGKEYTFDTLENMVCEEVRIIVESNITHQDSTNVCMKKVKQTTFDKDGVHIRCMWQPLETLNISSIRSCMMSVNKECFEYWYDSNVNLSPTIKRVDTTSLRISTDVNMKDVYYMGDVSIHHWAGYRGGGSENYSVILQDYGERYKSYFNCYDGCVVNNGDKLIAENHFNIVY